MNTKHFFLIGLILGILIISIYSISAACSGCLVGETCYDVGEKADINGNGQIRYCDLLTKTFLAQKILGSSCNNDFECAGDLPCLSGECYDIYGSIVDFNLDLTDADNDGIPGIIDNCPAISNVNQADADDDGIGDVCDAMPLDTDNDGLNNPSDNCPTVANPDQNDTDLDGIGDACDLMPSDTDNDGVNNTLDNCPGAFNPTQTDSDADGVGDACEPLINTTPIDSDGDGINNSFDNCVNVSNFDQNDTDLDGIGDACDLMPSDTDNDGVNNTLDNCPGAFNPTQTDSDADGVGDACDSTPNGVATGNGGSSSGGSKGPSIITSGNSYTLSSQNFQDGYVAYLKKGDIVLFYVNQVQHEIKIKDIFRERIAVEFDKNGKTIDLYVEKAQNFDVTNDALYDVETLVKAIYYSQGRVALNLRALHDLKPGTKINSETETNTETASVSASGSIGIYILVILAIIAGIAIIVYLYIVKKREMKVIKK